MSEFIPHHQHKLLQLASSLLAFTQNQDTLSDQLSRDQINNVINYINLALPVVNILIANSATRSELAGCLSWIMINLNSEPEHTLALETRAQLNLLLDLMRDLSTPDQSAQPDMREVYLLINQAYQLVFKLVSVHSTRRQIP